MPIDLNADLGEGAGHDAELMPWITSANICCGAHAGSPEEMRATVELAQRNGVVIGAHPGYADRANFGRVEHALEPHAVKSLCFQQIAALVMAGAEVKYVKPHGALYHRAMRDEGTAWGVAQAAEGFNLPCVGLPGSCLETACENFLAEGYADRRYRADRTLVPRDQPDALIDDVREALEQVEWLVGTQSVRTICVHGDNPAALEFVRTIRERLSARGHNFCAFA